MALILIPILSDPLAPGGVVPGIKHEPALFARRALSAAVIPLNLFSLLLRERELIQRFKFARFFNGQPDEHPSSAAINKISAGRTIHPLTALS